MTDPVRAARLLSFAIIAAILLCAAGTSLVYGQTGRIRTEGRLVLVADLTGAIGPASVRFVEKSIDTANDRQAELLVLRINTPGGLVTSMRDMIEDIIAAPLPVIGYVAPPGARAASAGTYIIYATHVAAMAPGTNIGAATPIQLGGLPSLPSPGEQEGKKKDDTSKDESSDQPPKDLMPEDPGKAKAVNDALAFIRSLAELRGRNVEWAEKAVRQAATLSAEGALEQNVVEILADDLDALLQALDGHRVMVGKDERILSTAGARIEQLQPGFISGLLAIITNPNVALILMMIGVYGLIFEFANPGSIGPGVVGVICLILGLYALNQLPLDYAGLALIILGLIFMTIEAFTPSFGVFGFGGITAFIIGATVLIDTDIPAYQISRSVIAGMAIASGAILIVLLGYVLRAARHPVRTGREGIAGQEAEVIDWSGREGHVWLAGERWHAKSNDTLMEGDKVHVQRLDGITLQVVREGAKA